MHTARRPFARSGTVLSAAVLLSLFVLSPMPCSRAAVARRTPVDAPPPAMLPAPPISVFPACPPGRGRQVLPELFPPTAVVFGYGDAPGHRELLETLISLLQGADQAIEIIVMVSTEELDDFTAAALRAPMLWNARGLRVLVTDTLVSMWVQDYFEPIFDLSTGRSAILDLPYPLGDEDDIPTELAEAMRLPLLAQPQWTLPDAPTRLSGDFGGNITAAPGNLLLVGNTMSAAALDGLSDTLEHSLHRVRVDWLGTGHVDELFAFLPIPGRSDPCGFALAWASPRAALRALADSAVPESFAEQRDALRRGVAEGFDDTDVDACLVLGPARAPDPRLCRDLLAANRAYQHAIESELSRIEGRLVETLGCRDFETLELPQLFIPGRNLSAWAGPDDEAEALNPNVVNSLSLGSLLILPRQPRAVLELELIRRLRPTGLELHFVDADHLHLLGGGLHCASNVFRGCAARTPGAPAPESTGRSP